MTERERDYVAFDAFVASKRAEEISWTQLWHAACAHIRETEVQPYRDALKHLEVLMEKASTRNLTRWEALVDAYALFPEEADAHE